MSSSFDVIILAAGLGSRLGELTKETPKPLIQVADHPLLAYSIAFAKRVGAAKIVIVTGAHGDQVRSAAADLDPTIVCVHNEDYRKGNLFSLRKGWTASDASTLIMNTDHLYELRLADLVRQGLGSSVTVFGDASMIAEPDTRTLQIDEAGRVKKIGKHLESWNACCIGMTFIPAERRDAYNAAAEKALQERGDVVGYEEVLQTFVADGSDVRMTDVPGICPFEVDSPEDLARAQSGMVGRTSDFLNS